MLGMDGIMAGGSLVVVVVPCVVGGEDIDACVFEQPAISTRSVTSAKL